MRNIKANIVGYDVCSPPCRWQVLGVCSRNWLGDKDIDMSGASRKPD